MHSKNVVHRDLKYENILFVNDSPKAEIKLIDFGLSKVYGDNTQLTDGVGTIYTMVSYWDLETILCDFEDGLIIFSSKCIAVASTRHPKC